MKYARFYLCALLNLLPLAGYAAPDGKIRFYSYYQNEARTIEYEKNGKLLPEAMKEIETLFRSRDSNQSRDVHPDLIRLIDRIEDHFNVRQVEVICGFRSEEFNRQLKATGHKVANESYHIKGMAADIHLDEISEEAIRDYVLSLKKGGVGYYPNHNMVHVDVGPVRRWGEAYPRPAWIGEKNKNAPLLMTVSPTVSVKKEIGAIKIERILPNNSAVLEPEIKIEFFEGPVWKEVASIAAEALKGQFPKLEYGKYRLVGHMQGSGEIVYSNEFYWKRK